MNNKNSYVCTISPEQAAELRVLMEPRGWVFDQIPYSLWRARLDKTTVTAYQSGKLTVQGRNTSDFVQFILEPEILHEARFGYEHLLAEADSPEMLTPHAGIDESGKGDYFGPLVIASVYVEKQSAQALLQAGVCDSKKVKSEKRIETLSENIKEVVRGRFNVVAIGPEAYNRLYDSFSNLNRLLAWAHARTLENLLERAPECPRAISDQFGNKKLVLDALLEKGREIQLEQMPRAEVDIAVAAASVLARAEFVRRLEHLGSTVGTPLPKGASSAVLQKASELYRHGGHELLRKVAKLHFRTTEQAIQAASS